MENFVHIGGRFWDRVSNTPGEVAASLGARILSQEEFDHPVCGRSIRCDVEFLAIPIPNRMSGKTVAGKLQIALSRMTTDPAVGGWLVSPALTAAVEESIPVAQRGDWARLAAILRVKSYISGITGERESAGKQTAEPFWEHLEGGRDDTISVYGVLDSLQFHASMVAHICPAGITVYGVREDGRAGVVDRAPENPPDDPSPTIRLLYACDSRYARQAEERRAGSEGN